MNQYLNCYVTVIAIVFSSMPFGLVADIEAMNEDDSLDADYDKDSGPSSAYARSIELPAEEIFRNLHNAKRFAIDIGELRCESTTSIVPKEIC